MLPLPAGSRTVIHETVLAAVHVQPPPETCVRVMRAEPPPAPNVSCCGEVRPYSQLAVAPAAWLMVWRAGGLTPLRPATVISALRDEPPLAPTVYMTFAGPCPLRPPVTVTQDALLVAVHWQSVGEAVAMKDPLPLLVSCNRS